MVKKKLAKKWERQRCQDETYHSDQWETRHPAWYRRQCSIQHVASTSCSLAWSSARTDCMSSPHWNWRPIWLCCHTHPQRWRMSHYCIPHWLLPAIIKLIGLWVSGKKALFYYISVTKNYVQFSCNIHIIICITQNSEHTLRLTLLFLHKNNLSIQRDNLSQS